MNSFKNKRILVTGGTGFIGGRIIEKLVLDHGAEVVALVHQFKNASRLARFPIQMVSGDIGDYSSLELAARKCDAIIHAAMSMSDSITQSRRSIVDGTKNVCEVAKANNSHLVHFSTISVYGNKDMHKISEDLPKNPEGDNYGLLKYEAEVIVQNYQRDGLVATILQPTIVYGPWSFWSTYARNLLKSGTLMLPRGGGGLCNAVYVDDVVEAVFLSLTRKEVAGPYLISGYKPITWQQFFYAHADDNIVSKIESMSDAEISDLRRELIIAPPKNQILPSKWKGHLKGLIVEFPGFKKVYNSKNGLKFLYQKLRGRQQEIRLPSSGSETIAYENSVKKVYPYASHLSLMESKSEVSIQKAKNELRYEPKFDISLGGQLTRQWIKWTGI